MDECIVFFYYLRIHNLIWVGHYLCKDFSIKGQIMYFKYNTFVTTRSFVVVKNVFEGVLFLFRQWMAKANFCCLCWSCFLQTLVVFIKDVNDQGGWKGIYLIYSLSTWLILCPSLFFLTLLANMDIYQD